MPRSEEKAASLTVGENSPNIALVVTAPSRSASVAAWSLLQPSGGGCLEPHAAQYAAHLARAGAHGCDLQRRRVGGADEHRHARLQGANIERAARCRRSIALQFIGSPLSHMCICATWLCIESFRWQRTTAWSFAALPPSDPNLNNSQGCPKICKMLAPGSLTGNPY